MRYNSIRKIALMAPAALIVGCGGGGSSTSSSPFAGSWYNGQVSAAMSVASNGTFTFTVPDAQSGTDTYSGTIDTDGAVKGTAFNSDYPNTVITVGGTAQLVTSSEIYMSLVLSYQGQSRAAAITFYRSGNAAPASTRPNLPSLADFIRK